MSTSTSAPSPSSLPPVPGGLRARHLRLEDSGVVYRLMAADQQAELGTVEIEEADVLGDWARPSTDLEHDSVLVHDDGTAVGYAEMVGPDRYDAAVHPGRRGEGVGTWLAAWVRQRARERGASIVGMPVPAGSAGDRLLTALGYHARWTSWGLEMPAGRAVPVRELPVGYTVREAAPSDHEAVWTVVEDAFLEWSERERQPFDDFRAQVVERPGFEPWLLLVATDPSGAVVGVSSSTRNEERLDVGRLAVRRDQRGRGLAQALLSAAFAAGRDHGAPVAGLSTDSRTGALSLYERVGMDVASTWVHRAIPL